jgi:hypothetical protein
MVIYERVDVYILAIWPRERNVSRLLVRVIEILLPDNKVILGSDLLQHVV